MVLALCAVLAVVLCWDAWTGYRAVTELGERGLAAERLAGQVVYHDEVLTGTARLAASEGNPDLAPRYRASAMKLDSVIAELRRIGEGELFDGSDLESVSRANVDLIAVEERALDLTAAGRSAEAAALLRSSDYVADKDEYAGGIGRVVADVRTSVDQRVASERRWALLWAAIAALALAATVVVWLLMRRLISRWGDALADADLRRKEIVQAEADRRFVALTQSSADTAVVSSPEKGILYASASIEKVSGFAPSALIGANPAEFLHPDDLPEMQRVMSVMADGGEAHAELRLRHADGDWRVMDTTWRDLRADPVVGGIVMNAHDVTERVAAQQSAQDALENERKHAQELARTEALLGELVSNAPIVFFALDETGTITLSMGHGLAAMGLGEGEQVGQSAWDLYSGNEQVISSMHAAYAGRSVAARVEFGAVVFQVAYMPVSENGKTVGVVGVATDVTSQAQLEDELRHRAEHDALTGLANRTTFHEAVEAALHRAPHETAVVMLDIDGFKEINDTRGHEAGDRVLTAVSQRLGAALRGDDLVARLGGDEFGFLIRTSNPTIVDSLTARVLEAIAQPIPDITGAVHLTASAGVVGPGAPADHQQALRDADLAMYDAKRTNGNRLSRFDPEMREQFMARIQLKDELTLAIADDQLRVEYQPLIETSNGGVVGVEALVRWQHPQRGLLAPGAFLSAAEETGQITAIDEFVLRKACRQIASWRATGDPLLSGMWVTVNLSAVDFARDDLVPMVSSALADADLPATALVLEITETAAMRNVEETMETLAALSEIGVRIALDDFGTGYSSLSQLQQLQVDILKVDRSFVADSSDDDALSLAETIVGLGKLLGLKVVAEGIETPAQLETMNGAGCDLVQGFLFSHPLDPDSCRRLIRDLAANGAVPAAEA